MSLAQNPSLQGGATNWREVFIGTPDDQFSAYHIQNEGGMGPWHSPRTNVSSMSFVNIDVSVCFW